MPSNLNATKTITFQIGVFLLKNFFVFTNHKISNKVYFKILFPCIDVFYFKKIKEKSQYFYISEIYSNNRMNILINLESKPKVRNFLIAILLCLISCSLNNI